MNRYRRNHSLHYLYQLEMERRRRISNTLLLSLLLLTRTKEKKYRPKRFWIRDIFKNRKQQGAYHNLFNEMKLTDTQKYFNYLRMSSESFNYFCVRETISSGERLALTLR